MTTFPFLNSAGSAAFASQPTCRRLGATALLLACGAGTLGAQTAPAPTVVHKIESGVSYSRGDYGLTEDTEVFVVLATYVLDASSWRLRATLPWLHISGPAAVVANGTGSIGGPVRPTDASESGFGDSMLSLTYKINPLSDGLRTDFTAKVKAPTGDEDRGLGTGEFDYYAQLDFYRSFNGTTPFFNAGYRYLGDGLYQLDDGFYASGGVVVPLSDPSSIGAAVDWREAIVPGGDDAVEATAFYFTRINTAWTATIYGQKGFTDASPDYGAGASFSFQF